MADNTILQESNFFRMGKSLITTENINQLYSISSDHIAESILYHICYEHQYNLFGFGRIDPEQFGNFFGFSRQYLFQKHENPYQKMILRSASESKTKKSRAKIDGVTVNYGNRLENSLFILANLPLFICRTLIDDNNKIVRKMEPVRILKNIYIEQDKRTGKLFYTYELEESFRRNLSTLYLTSNTRSLINLRKSGYAPIYQYLLSLKDELFRAGETTTTAENTPTFDYLCKLANIKNREPKYMKRDLNSVFKKINKETELEFSVDWIRYNSTEKYTPIITFYQTLFDTIGCDTRQAIYKRKEERLDVACVEFKHNLYEQCPYRSYEYIDRAEEMFYEWIKLDTPQQRKLLAHILTQTFINMDAPIPDNIKERINFLVENSPKYDKSNFDHYIKQMFSSEKFKFYNVKQEGGVN